MFGLTVSALRATSVPSARRTNSFRIWCASSAASAASSGLITSCVIPLRSRRSTKIRPPWSRRRAAQPARIELLADELLRGLARHVGAPRGHRDSLPRTSAWATGSSCSPARRISASAGTDDHRGRRARAARLRQLALERAAGVVRVGGDAGVAQSLQQRWHERARCVGLDGDEDVDAPARPAPRRPRPPSRSAAARSRRRSRRPASAARRSPRRGSRSGRRRRWSSSRCPSGR